MKNYPHLYTPATKKASFSNQIKTHKKTTSIVGAQPTQYNKIPSSKTINHTNTPLSRRSNNHPRISSRSIQEMHLDRSSEDNYDMMQRKNLLLQEHRQINKFYPPPTFGQFGSNSIPIHYQTDQYSVQSNEDNELFQRSYQKIGQIKYQVHNKNIDHQLNEVLELIKEQKLRANQTVKTLKKAADHYKRICQTVTKSFSDTSVNTEEQLAYFKQVSSKDISIQCQSEEKIKIRQSSPTFAKVELIKDNQCASQNSTPKKSQIKEQKIDGKQIQIYTKLATMLEDMNINSKQILPEDIHLNFEVKNYKNLNEAEIIKIQKFFIKKLVQKIPK